MTQSRTPFRELERLFEQMQENVEEPSRWWEPLAGGGESRSVQVDLEDRGPELVLTAELPGFDRDDIDVRLTGRTLHLEAEHEEEKSEEESEGKFIRRERRRTSVSRSLRLPDDVETSATSATYDNGILTIRMPKSEPEAQGAEIEVR